MISLLDRVENTVCVWGGGGGGGKGGNTGYQHFLHFPVFSKAIFIWVIESQDCLVNI